MRILSIGQYNIGIYEPSAKAESIVYLHADSAEGAEIWRLLPEPKPVLAVISGTDWNRDFSPWPADKVFSKGEDFSGGSKAYLDALTGLIIPETEAALPHVPRMRAIAGYSLAGLFALWCAYSCDAFDRIAALSPSAWFDGFTAFAGSHPISPRLQCCVLSLGDREKNTRNPRMAAVETAVHTVENILIDKNISVLFIPESGGHFNDIPGRIARGIAATYTSDHI